MRDLILELHNLILELLVLVLQERRLGFGLNSSEVDGLASGFVLLDRVLLAECGAVGSCASVSTKGSTANYTKKEPERRDHLCRLQASKCSEKFFAR